MKVYIAGPMRGIPLYNFPAFDAAASELRDEGHEVVNPADLDRDTGMDPLALPSDWDWNDLPPSVDSNTFADRDLEALRGCDAIYLLKGWQQSTGAMAEYHVAKWRGLTLVYELPSPAESRKQIPIASGLLDYFPDAIRAIAYCSWVGNEQHNPGEPLHWAREKSADHADCALRHFMERGTVDTDGVRHMTKAAWRVLALLQLELEAQS